MEITFLFILSMLETFSRIHFLSTLPLGSKADVIFASYLPSFVLIDIVLGKNQNDPVPSIPFLLAPELPKVDVKLSHLYFSISITFTISL